MASVKMAVILSVISLLLLLSHATRLPAHPDATDAITFARDAPEDADPTTAATALDPAVDADPTVLPAIVEKKEASEVSLPVIVEGFDHVDLSLRRPFDRRPFDRHPFHRHPFHRHFHHRHCRHNHRRQHGHWFHGGEVVPYGNDMIPLPKDGDLDGGLKKAEEAAAASEVVSAGESRGVPREEVSHWGMVTEWKEAAEEGSWRKKKNKEHKRKKAREEDSDSDSDDEEEEEMEMAKKMKKGGLLKWIWDLWY